MKQTSLVFLVIIFLSGCASTHMKQYLQKDVREIAIDNGPPVNAFDMGDGRRVFQWRWGGGTFVVPATTTSSGSLTSVGNTAWFSSNTITNGGGMVTSEGCVLAYFTEWDGSKNAWIVTEFRIPKRLVC